MYAPSFSTPPSPLPAAADPTNDTLQSPSPISLTPKSQRHHHLAHSSLNATPSPTAQVPPVVAMPSPAQGNTDAAEDDEVRSAAPTASTRSRGRRSRRAGGSEQQAQAAAARAGVAVCCDGVSVRRHHRDIIDDVSCLFRGGRVTAVVNSCGTHSALALLAAVAGRVECTAGTLVMNGVPVSASAYQAQMSFIEERDAMTEELSGATADLVAELTVRENLLYASVLRVTDAAQAYSVDEVLQQLLLESHQNTKIRQCGLYVRRRVALGKELLLNPSLLIVDEPMEGLATYEAQQFLTILSKLAAPSAADAEARHAMHEATLVSSVAGGGAASTSTTGDTNTTIAVSASTVASGDTARTESQATASPVSVYTPRLNRGTGGGGGGVSPGREGGHRGATPTTSPTSGVGTLGVGSRHDGLLTASTPVSGSRDAAIPASSAAASGAPRDVVVSATSVATAAVSTQRVVILSMVQPRWALLQYVHDVVLLERSRCVFAGSVQDLLSVRLSKELLRPHNPCTENGEGAGTGETGSNQTGNGEERGMDGGRRGGDDNSVGASTDCFNSLRPSSAPDSSYDAVAAAIHRTRLNEEKVHALYRLATAAASLESGTAIVTGDVTDFGSFMEATTRSMVLGATLTPGDAGVASTLSIDSVGVQATPLYTLYVAQRRHTQTEVSAYMAMCATGQLMLPETSHKAPTGLVRLGYLFQFGFLELRHNWLWDLLSLGFMLILAALLAALYGVQQEQVGIQNRVGIIFFLVCCVVLQAVLSLDQQRREYAAFYRYFRSGYYAAWTFLTFRAITAALWRFGIASFVALIVFILSNFGEPWEAYSDIFELGVIMAVLSYCSYFLVWFLCTWWPSDRVSRFLVFTFYTLNIILAGLVLNLMTLPGVVRVLSYFSVMRLAYESAILTQFLGKSFGCNEPSSDSSVKDGVSRKMSGEEVQTALQQATKHPVMYSATSPCYTGDEYAAFLGFAASRRWSNVGLLAGLSGGLLAVSWVMMVLYRPRRRPKVPG